jgi:hypothetical protein
MQCSAQSILRRLNTLTIDFRKVVVFDIRWMRSRKDSTEIKVACRGIIREAGDDDENRRRGECLPLTPWQRSGGKAATSTCKAETLLPLKAVTRWRYFSDARHSGTFSCSFSSNFSHRLISYQSSLPFPTVFIFFILSVVNFNTDALTIEVIFTVEMGC